ncbi:TonB C-terminal domain-containing protein [bacterium]|nr:TonB C-terminal domain-containing protein [bacterium]
MSRNITASILISLIAHLLCLRLLVVDKPQPESPKLYEVSLKSITDKPEAKAKPTAQTQSIVSPSQAPETKPDEQKNVRLSDKDTRAVKETIRRGDEAGDQVANQTTRSQAQKNSKQSLNAPKPSAQSVEKLTPLALDHNLAALSGEVPTNTAKQESAEKNNNTGTTLKDFLPGSKGSSMLRAGSSDFLPDVADGDVTLLNAKANKYAVFVRRVALQVFGALKQRNWQQISREDIRNIKTPAEFRAVLSPDGKLLSIEQVNQSGSSRFDEALEGAVKAGAWDKNPPSGARAENGNIIFVFQAQTWSQPSMRGIGEARYLLLGTGLL